MKTITFPRVLSFGFALFLAACASITPHYSRPVDFVEPMNNLTLAVDAELRNPFRTNIISGCQLLQAAMDQKPELRKAFQTATLMITNRNRNAVVLLLNPKNRGLAWIEGATWSSELTRSHYLSNPPSPAQFSIPLP